MSFASEVKHASNVIGKSFDETAKQVTFALFKAVIVSTPVDTGRLRGNWQTTKNSPAKGTTNRRGESGAISEARSTINKAGLYYLTNNLPYAAVAEYGLWGKGSGATHKTAGTGFSIQAPHGMVRVNVVRMRAKLRSLK